MTQRSSSKPSSRPSLLSFPRADARRGAVLIVVLIIIALLSLTAYTFSDLMLTERKATHIHGKQIQVRALADSGIESVLQYFKQGVDEEGHFDNPNLFRGVEVITDKASHGRFSIVAPGIEGGQVGGWVRFGLEDESTRINLNTLLLADKLVENGAREILMTLPGMSEQVADSILDWIDEDDEPRPFGAESADYATFDPPYAPRNGPLETVEELLLVLDRTTPHGRLDPWLLFGADINRNGMIDPGEASVDFTGFESPSGEGNDLDRGWAGYLTLYSQEKNLRPDGSPRVDLNNNDLRQLYAQLIEAFADEPFGEQWAKFIILFRQYGASAGGGTPGTILDVEIDFDKPAKRALTTVLDLIGESVNVSVVDEDSGSVKTLSIEPVFPNDPLAMNFYMPQVLDHVTINPSPVILGRININQASRVVLMGIPGMTEEIVEQIIENRLVDPFDQENEAAATQRHETWILQGGIVTLLEMKALIPFVTAGGSVFRAQSVGYLEETSTPNEFPAVRIEFIIDATTETPRMLFWRDLSHLPRGYSLIDLGGEVTEDF